MTPTSVSLDPALLREKIMGCWLGKAVGGTLGQPYEGVTHELALDFYEPVPTEMIPNDDLDLQVVSAVLLDRMAKPNVNRDVLIPMWTEHVGMSPDEYGICKRNLKLGLLPPHTGSFDNWFAHGMGAAIRTELWACLAPGDPDLAAAYAYEDACLDHAGEGIDAAKFLAALEALAFVETDRDTLLDQALKRIPEESAVARAIADTRQWWADSEDWRDVRRRILKHHGHENFTDVCQNLAFTILGWLAAEGDFGRGICVAVNCGMDTDCTGATLGALLGILDPAGIPKRWLEPIGRDLVLSPSISLDDFPDTLDGFTDLVINLRERLDGQPPDIPKREKQPPRVTLPAEVGFLPIDRSRNHATDPVRAAPDALPRLGEMHAVALPGSVAAWPAERFEGGTLVVRYRFEIDREKSVKVLFNTPESVRIYIDGRLVMNREGGRMCPAMHRAPAGQMVKRTFAPGTHEVVGLIDRPGETHDVQWVFGLGTDAGDNVCDDWLTCIYDVQPA